MAAMNFIREAAGALAGLLAGAVALGVAELTAAVTGARGAPVVAVGEAAINLTPVPVKEFAITHFGTHDKLALVTGILVLLAGFAAVIGLLAVRRLALGLAGLGAFAAVGVADKQELTKILTYHVASGRQTPSQLASGMSIKTLEGGTVTGAMMNGTYSVNKADVVCGNVQTANATVYIINTVLMPPSS